MVSDSEKLKGPESPEAKASEELLELGLECLPENVKAVADQQKTPQHPEGFEEILDNLNSPEKLKAAMREKGIKRVIHAEGPSVWDHCKATIKAVESMNIPEDKKTNLKLLMLFHDLGKTDPKLKDRRSNREILEKELRRGKLYQAMAGHAEGRSQDVEDGFKANGLGGRKLEVFMTVVKNHMNASLMEMSALRLVKLFEGFGKNDDERREVAELLVLALLADGNANQNIELTADGKLVYAKNEQKVRLDFGKVWARYEACKKELEAD